MDKRKVVIVGGGSGGAILANLLPLEQFDVTVIDKSEYHVFQPGALFVAFRYEPIEKFKKPMLKVLKRGVKFVHDEVTKIDLNERVVETKNGNKFDYDYVVIAAGVHLNYDFVEGNRELLNEFGDYYHSLESALKLRHTLERLRKGTFLIGVVDPLYKCPPAPHKGAFLSRIMMINKGRKDTVKVILAVPYPHSYPSKVISEIIDPKFKELGIEVKTYFTVDQIDTKNKKITSLEGEELSYDVAVVIPYHEGPKIDIEPNNVRDENGFIKIDKYTGQIVGFDDAYAIGDCSNAPTSKSGVTVHLQAEVVADRLMGLDSKYSGRTNCPLIMGDEAIFIISDYDHPPIPARPSRFKGLMEEIFVATYWTAIRRPRFWRKIFEAYFEATEPAVLGERGW